MIDCSSSPYFDTHTYVWNSSHLGYVTINAKYIILVEDVIAPDDIQIQKTRENELKILLVSPGNKAC